MDVLLLDKTGTITLGNRQATEFMPAPGVAEKELADAAQLSSLADETPEGRSVVVLAKKFGIRAREIHELANAQFVKFSAQTRMSVALILTASSIAKKGPPTLFANSPIARPRPKSAKSWIEFHALPAEHLCWFPPKTKFWV